jgi:eukaryotic-like serine/threonine-protein kinase
MPPMVTPPPTEPVASATGDDTRFETSASNPSPRDRGSPARQGEGVAESNPPQRANSDEDLIRSAEQFVNTLNRRGTKGGLLKIARGADLELPATEFAGSGQWQIEAEPGPVRPRIRFRSSAFSNRSPTAWTVLFNLRSGSMRLQGLDILIQNQDQDAPRAGRLAAVGVSPGTELVVSDCTITVGGQAANSASIVVQPVWTEPGTPDARVGNRIALVEVGDAFLRSAGDCFNVTSGRQLDLRLRNVLIGTDGSLLHALGSSQIERSKTALKLRIDRTLALTRGGLVHLESTVNETELPLTEIVAEDSIFSTAGQAPLFRVDGQGQMEGLRDRIVWKAERVAYDQITTYRRDQILQTGVSPRDYTRLDWRNAFEPKDVSPVLDDVRFHTKLDPGKSAWQLSKGDMRLDPTSPAVDRGPDMVRIPDPPSPGL